ncbi:hypothetical protein KBC79_02160 [Candidatus Woesebacteria bacterium]|nr:hypothetical protein [Candidatus Woesebacteria bacterium]
MSEKRDIWSSGHEIASLAEDGNNGAFDGHWHADEVDDSFIPHSESKNSTASSSTPGAELVADGYIPFESLSAETQFELQKWVFVIADHAPKSTPPGVIFNVAMYLYEKLGDKEPEEIAPHVPAIIEALHARPIPIDVKEVRGKYSPFSEGDLYALWADENTQVEYVLGSTFSQDKLILTPGQPVESESRFNHFPPSNKRKRKYGSVAKPQLKKQTVASGPVVLQMGLLLDGRVADGNGRVNSRFIRPTSEEKLEQFMVQLRKVEFISTTRGALRPFAPSEIKLSTPLHVDFKRAGREVSFRQSDLFRLWSAADTRAIYVMGNYGPEQDRLILKPGDELLKEDPSLKELSLKMSWLINGVQGNHSSDESPFTRPTGKAEMAQLLSQLKKVQFNPEASQTDASEVSAFAPENITVLYQATPRYDRVRNERWREAAEQWMKAWTESPRRMVTVTLHMDGENRFSSVVLNTEAARVSLPYAVWANLVSCQPIDQESQSVTLGAQQVSLDSTVREIQQVLRRTQINGVMHPRLDVRVG